jgi:hypothetical protein
VRRGADAVRLALPCSRDRAAALHEAERAMWTAIAARNWKACMARGEDMIAAFGAAISPPLMVMSQCAAAVPGESDPSLLNTLAHALLSEMTAHPDPAPEVRADMREQLFLVLRDLERIRLAGGVDYATALRGEMSARGVVPPAPAPGELRGR